MRQSLAGEEMDESKNSQLSSLRDNHIRLFVVGIIVAMVNGVAVLIAGQFGLVAPLISGILAAFITPIVP